MTIKKTIINGPSSKESIERSESDTLGVSTTPRESSPEHASLEGNHGEKCSDNKGVDTKSVATPPPKRQPINRTGKGGFVKGGRTNPKRAPSTHTKNIIADADQYNPSGTLKKLGFDPIVAVVKTIKELDQKLRWMKKQPKPSMPAIAQMMNTKRALVADLLRYGYRPVPEKTVNEQIQVPIGITLTDKPMSEIGLEVAPLSKSSLSKDDSDSSKAEVKH